MASLMADPRHAEARPVLASPSHEHAFRPAADPMHAPPARASAPAARSSPLPLRGLNHVSLCVRDVAASAAFYQDILGFQEVRRPSCFEFDGSW